MGTWRTSDARCTMHGGGTVAGAECGVWRTGRLSAAAACGGGAVRAGTLRWLVVPMTKSAGARCGLGWFGVVWLEMFSA